MNQQNQQNQSPLVTKNYDQYRINNLNSEYTELQASPFYNTTEISKLQQKYPTYGGNWSRTKYDAGSLGVDVRQSTLPLEYQLDPNYAERCNQCRPLGPGWIAKQGVSYDANHPLIDTESELFNLNRVLTRDPNYQYKPHCPECENNPSGYPCGGGIQNCNQAQLSHIPSCNFHFEYTRISNPTSTLRETGINRFNPICLNPQDRSRWEHPGETGINYRMIAKDNHIPCIPIPMDPTPVLPKGGDLPCELTIPVCASFIGSLHNYY